MKEVILPNKEKLATISPKKAASEGPIIIAHCEHNDNFMILSCYPNGSNTGGLYHWMMFGNPLATAVPNAEINKRGDDGIGYLSAEYAIVAALRFGWKVYTVNSLLDIPKLKDRI